MDQKHLPELLQDLEQEMQRLHYTEETLKFYRGHWKKLMEFARERDKTEYSEKLGLDFIERHFGLLERSHEQKLKSSEVQKLRVIRMIGDFQLHHTILRRCYKFKQILMNPYWIACSDRFRKHCKEKTYSTTTINHYVKQSANFMDYLTAQDIRSCEEIDLNHINNYIKTLAGYSYKTVEQNICSLRAFFRFLFEKEEIITDFSTKIPMVQARKQTRIPSVWTEEELKKLIGAIDRANPKGKRDYTIILLACRLVPISDNLSKRCQEYSAKIHSFASPDDYFFPAMNGRPMTLTNVYHNFRRFLWRAGIGHGGRGCGPRIHDFRHTYAVHCLKKWSEQGKELAVYLPVLRTYMGHDSFQDTAYYLRMTADVFPAITIKLEGMYPKIIPELAGDFHETN